MKTIINKYFRRACQLALTLSLTLSFALTSCSDEPLAENYYTFTGEMASDYLSNRPDQYSQFIEILQRSGMYGMIATYGSYTCFAPTNEAVNKFLQSRGLSSVSELDDAECDTISWNHIVQKAYFTTDLSTGRIPEANMNDRFLQISCDSTDGNIEYYVNLSSKLVVRDDSVENGVVHTIDKVIVPSSNYIIDLIARDKSLSIFYQAMQLTGLADSLFQYEDKSYSIADPDSVYKGVPFRRTGANFISKYIEKRYYRYTVLAEPNSVYEKLGWNIDSLKAFAKSTYDATYPQDAGKYDSDYKHPKNPLHRFVAYHILPYYCDDTDFTISESEQDYKTTCSMPNLIDATDWYTTFCPGTIMKVSSPSEGLFINRKGVNRKYEVRGVKIYSLDEMKNVCSECGGNPDSLVNAGLNGIYHYLDDVLAYTTETRDNVFNTRIRWNVVTMTPEFLNAGVRGYTTSNSTLYGFKQVEGWDFHGKKPTLTLRERNVWNATYADAVDLIGQFDVAFKLPPVPENTYEIRFAYGSGNDRGVVQIYFGEKDNMQPMGLPIDFRKWGGDPSIGWVADVEDEEENRAMDKAMHNRGYMKDMDSWNQGGSNNLRANSGKFRKILTTQTMSPEKEYWIRIKLVIENDNAELPINYFEFCPKSVYAGLNAEDTH